MQESLKKLKSSENGLNSIDVKRKLKIFWHNELSKKRKHSIIIESLQRSVNPLVIILLIRA